MSENTPNRRSWKLFQSVRPLSGSRALRDALAGFQLAAMNIPQALGYTKIAGTPVVTGFYTLLLPPLAFAAFGSSRYLVVAADPCGLYLANCASPSHSKATRRHCRAWPLLPGPSG